MDKRGAEFKAMKGWVFPAMILMAGIAMAIVASALQRGIDRNEEKYHKGVSDARFIKGRPMVYSIGEFKGSVLARLDHSTPTATTWAIVTSSRGVGTQFAIIKNKKSGGK